MSDDEPLPTTARVRVPAAAPGPPSPAAPPVPPEYELFLSVGRDLHDLRDGRPVAGLTAARREAMRVTRRLAAGGWARRLFWPAWLRQARAALAAAAPADRRLARVVVHPRAAPLYADRLPRAAGAVVVYPLAFLTPAS